MEVRCVVLSGGDIRCHEGSTLLVQTLTGWAQTGATGRMLWPVLVMCKSGLELFIPTFGKRRTRKADMHVMKFIFRGSRSKAMIR